MSFEDVILRNDVAGVRAFFNAVAKNAVNAVNGSGYVPLYFACMKPSVSPEVIKELVQLGAAVDGRGTDGETPLYISVYNHRLDVAKYLIARKADVNAVNGPHRETALHVAARCGFADILSFLLSAGADLNMRNARQETPLYVAAQAGRHDTVYLLLEADANAALANEDDKTPLHIASEKEYKHVVVLFKAARADLKHAKSLADTEWRLRPEPMMSSDQMLDKAAADQQFAAAVRRRSLAGAPAPDTKPMEVVEIKVPEPQVRRQNPLTGESYGPCRSLEEVGYDSPPPIPKELQNRPPARLSRIGGTSMVVGTGTEEGGREPIRIDSIGGDGVEYYAPPNK
ncbi:Ankyrin repeats (3 copies)/Ankyrin repeat/Ankyrin repeats (many copies) [Leishmania donovani]|uniref:Ankyrin_repeats_(3_copies)/Ankyrin_repeat/Ankyrin _repeats_(Many_copies)_-_putative n=3 Tax=Leishmania donovani species complex TaxID=38574 RepID=A0A6L0Y0N4_LEIIN|nr:conserved hypothetical protein [Leishmania infantum JPCM5]XP_003864493.1 hypothetical protein, conserved [Leishmania donovani]CAC9540822.1 Ankyrin_repeats_(3_copies)/Ankyrin_repeat/Ankyrin_repeats_(many_copies)_-_putative [Leishmania infantum]AYU82701.1 Ankyrin repeats (3 copies)/Ankyrin repeat/Ankyrin repeats (many copies), putative [Leishmania donovani]TPP40242.1 Ankyrin repeats (3 copies) family protein [Leishmania donovani]TPP46764.1 Ankyrin repeats (3 copies) family protein [Leishmania|eukprot:XP_001468691.1 conserved hypothetical protein [Leishmania infantum JPCM5]